ncbi:ComF family protein [Albibacterium profundi]|uniref:ComF family protein n=1 Tax=Albibacterium profundi TaxID=3134906 RepID=A0ABV5CDA0_9SPHI
MSLIDLVKDSIALLFPELCIGCNRNLVKQEKYLCLNCSYDLPVTNYHLDSDSLIDRRLKARLPLAKVSAYLYFTGGSRVQRIIHHIKYQNGFALARFLGQRYGEIVKDSAYFQDIDVIVPVPLHKKRQRQRGYNQSEYIAHGLSEVLGAQVSTGNLIRLVHKKSQTKTSGRYERFENMENMFAIHKPDEFENKHVLLVDDVLTTGATLEACAIALLRVQNIKLSVATLAFTK